MTEASSNLCYLCYPRLHNQEDLLASTQSNARTQISLRR